MDMKTQLGTCSIEVSASYNNGETLCEDRKFPARTKLQSVLETNALREVAIRMVVSTDVAEELFEGLNSGTVELSIKGMKTKVERN
jgi:hypothetical protein